MSLVLNILETAEYQQYSKKFKNFIGFNMRADEICLENKKGALYSLKELSFDECFNLIKESLSQNKNNLLEYIKNNKIEADLDGAIY